MLIQENILLSNMTTMRVGGPARFFCSVGNIQELAEAVLFAKKKNLSVFVLGEGSNIVMSDKGFDGLVLKLDFNDMIFSDVSRDKTEVTASAGVHWDTLVGEVVLKNLYGIENLSLIPGTVGAAPIQNIGAYGAELSDVLEWVEVFDMESGRVKRLAKDECAFGYRDSIFKHREGKNFIVTQIGLVLAKDGAVNTEYKDLKNYFEIKKIQNPTLQAVRRGVSEIRTNKFPEMSHFGTVGSFFKNPVISKEKYEELLKKYPALPGFNLVSNVNGQMPAPYRAEGSGSGSNVRMKVPLAWVLDNICGLRGLQKGHVGLYVKQPLALVNYGDATAEEVKKFAEFAQKEVYKKIGIVPEYEISFIGEF